MTNIFGGRTIGTLVFDLAKGEVRIAVQQTATGYIIDRDFAETHYVHVVHPSNQHDIRGVAHEAAVVWDDLTLAPYRFVGSDTGIPERLEPLLETLSVPSPIAEMITFLWNDLDSAKRTELEDNARRIGDDALDRLMYLVRAAITRTLDAA